MGKAAKKANKIRRLAQKRARREANRLKYESWRREGRNRKTKRARGTEKKSRLVRVLGHPDVLCGNLACSRCYKEV